MIKRNPKPPTFYPVNSIAGQSQPRQCECCGKLQTIGEGFDIRSELCGECVEGFNEPITQSGSIFYSWHPGLWYRFTHWIMGWFV